MVIGIDTSADRLDTMRINCWVKQVLPSLTGREMRMLFTKSGCFLGVSRIDVRTYTSMDAPEAIRSICGYVSESSSLQALKA